MKGGKVAVEEREHIHYRSFQAALFDSAACTYSSCTVHLCYRHHMHTCAYLGWGSLPRQYGASTRVQ